MVCEDRDGKYFQIWVNNKDAGFSLAQVGRFPNGFQSVSFGDIGPILLYLSVDPYLLTDNVVDRDGTIDMLFVTCDSVSSSSGIGSGCAINIAYNKQLPLCSSTSFKNSKRACRPPEGLCEADPDFQFYLQESDDNTVPTTLIISTLCYTDVAPSPLELRPDTGLIHLPLL